MKIAKQYVRMIFVLAISLCVPLCAQEDAKINKQQGYGQALYERTCAILDESEGNAQKAAENLVHTIMADQEIDVLLNIGKNEGYTVDELITFAKAVAQENEDQEVVNLLQNVQQEAAKNWFSKNPVITTVGALAIAAGSFIAYFKQEFVKQLFSDCLQKLGFDVQVVNQPANEPVNQTEVERLAAEQARIVAEQEAQRVAAEQQEALRIAAEEEAQRLANEQEARLAAEQAKPEGANPEVPVNSEESSSDTDSSDGPEETGSTNSDDNDFGNTTGNNNIVVDLGMAYIQIDDLDDETKATLQRERDAMNSPVSDVASEEVLTHYKPQKISRSRLEWPDLVEANEGVDLEETLEEEAARTAAALEESEIKCETFTMNDIEVLKDRFKDDYSDMPELVSVGEPKVLDVTDEQVTAANVAIAQLKDEELPLANQAIVTEVASEVIPAEVVEQVADNTQQPGAQEDAQVDTNASVLPDAQQSKENLSEVIPAEQAVDTIEQPVVQGALVDLSASVVLDAQQQAVEVDDPSLFI